MLKKFYLLVPSVIFLPMFIGMSSAQNVGIGTTTPAGRLHIKGNADTSQLVIDANATQGNIPLIRLRSAYGADILHLRSDTLFNVFLGFSAGANNSKGSGWFNTFIGSNSGFYNTLGQFNTALGRASLYQNTTGNGNTALGFHTLFSNTLGDDNTAVGNGALDFNQLGWQNTAVGARALKHNITAGENTAVGSNALGTQSFNTYTPTRNTAVGSFALFLNNPTANNNGINNTAIGSEALYWNTTGSRNTASGARALHSNSTGHSNTAAGIEALYANQTGVSNSAFGADALKSNVAGVYNTAVGSQAMLDNTTGYYNTAIGDAALLNLVSGSVNTAAGYGSGTAIGASAVSNTISIGNHNYHNAYSNQAFFGNVNILWNGGNVNWSTFSDARIKTNIQEDVEGLGFITRLRPVTYFRNTEVTLDITGNKDSINYPEKYDIEKIKFSGFIGQEVEQAAKATGYDFDGVQKPKNQHQLYSISYASFVVPLVKAVQEQQVIIELLQNKIELLEKRLAALEK